VRLEPVLHRAKTGAVTDRGAAPAHPRVAGLRRAGRRSHSDSVVHSSSGLTSPAQRPAYSPFAESPSRGSVTWKETMSRSFTCWSVRCDERVDTKTLTKTTPSLSRLPGTHAVDVYVPGSALFCQRVSVSSALKLCSPDSSVTI